MSYSDDEEDFEYSGASGLIANQELGLIERTFKTTIRNIQLKNTKDLTKPMVVFTLGGNYHEEDRRHAGEGIVKTGKKGATFKTEALAEFEDREGGTFTKEFTKYWKGGYEDLAEQELLIQVYDVRTCGCSKELMGEARLNLEKWADGSIQQELELRLREGGRNLIAGDITFLGYFQEVWDFKLLFYDWKGTNLRAMDNSGTSDPYLKISFDKNWAQMFQGGLSRSCKGEVCMETLFPQWEEIGTITYKGTRSELENEIFKIECYDWDRGSADDLIGSADVLFRGVIDYGSVDTELRYTKTSKRNGETVTEVISSGGLEGYLSVESMPRYEQEGDIVIPIPGVRYLAVKINSAHNLRATDDNGSTDAFVTVTWGGTTQTTKVIHRNLNPKWNETLYFPVRLVSDSADALAKKGPVKVYVWDWDEAGNDQQGQFDIALSDITRGSAGKYDGQNTTRIFKETAQKLFTANVDEESDATVDFECWFQPDFAASLVVEEDAQSQIRVLPEEFKTRETEWRAGIPQPMLKSGEYAIEASDESGAFRFLPTFLQPINPPKDLRGEPLMVARTVGCFTFASDVDAFDGLDDVWCSTNYFLDMKKGDAEEHAMLLCNIFLGMKLDAYCVNGKTKNGEDHTWVMTREADGSVIVWETTNGKRYVLPERWTGTMEEEDEYSDEDEDDVVDVEEVTVETDKGKAKAPEITNDMLNDNVDVVFDEDDIRKDNAAYPSEEVEVFEVDAGPKMTMPGGVEGLSKINLPYMSIETIFNHENLWANIQHPDPSKVKYDLEDPLQWKAFVDFDEGFSEEVIPFFSPRALGPAIRGGRLEALESTVYMEVCAGVTAWRHGEHMETEVLHEMREVLKEGLEYMELKKVSYDPEDYDPKIAAWQGKISVACPPKHKFKGVPLCFFYTDAKKIRKVLMNKFDFHREDDANCKFAFGVHVAPYPGGVAAVWIYYCVMVPVE
eukprot:TRINITY_DN844_c1_g1_i4.p1 TRINITY_DN844_c1_g1~~TRINITY_DN844_c1_g1_i4.p1  ORF type:complete len:959 (+),score=365.48 TRINITY_DN844_c1_g1_i4:2563-5439(+)